MGDLLNASSPPGTAHYDALCMSDPAAMPASITRRPLRLRLWIVGAAVLAVIALVCLASLPWTLGAGADPLDPAGRTRARYDIQSLDVNLLPPRWSRFDADDASRYAAFIERAESAAKEANIRPNVPRYWLGTDPLGRDFLARLLLGGSVSLGIGVAAAAISVVIGTLWGMIAGYAGGTTDAIMMRIVDVLYGLPYVLLVVLLAVGMDGLVESIEAGEITRQAEAVAIGASFQPSWKLTFIRNNGPLINICTLLIAIGGVSWLTMARVIRGQVLSLKAQPFMESCRAIGVPVRLQFTRHLLPNLMGPIIVYATLTVPQAILQESFLSFLGIGIQAPMPSWGNLAAEGLTQLNPVESRWWLLLFPCLLLALTLLALNFIGEGLREALHPKRRTMLQA